LVPNLTECKEHEYSSGYICDGETFIDPEIYSVWTLCDVASNDNIDELSFSVFPNPSYGDLNLSFETINQRDIQIDMYSNDGRMVFSKAMLSGDTSMAIDLSDLPSGLYFLKASMDNKIAIRKWVKY